MTQRSLLIGCGNNHTKQVQWAGQAEWSGALTKLDMNPNCGADVVFDLDEIATCVSKTECVPLGRLPFDDNTFDEIGAYNCMEHWGRQGDWRGWFAEMSEYHRVLKPGGIMGIIVPEGGDALADPGHTRFFQDNYFGFLNQAFYTKNKLVESCFTDYRWFWWLNFDILHLQHHGGHHMSVVLRKT